MTKYNLLLNWIVVYTVIFVYGPFLLNILKFIIILKKSIFFLVNFFHLTYKFYFYFLNDMKKKGCV